jgi:hypothetical protein
VIEITVSGFFLFMGAVLCVGFGWGYIVGKWRALRSVTIIEVPDFIPGEWSDQEEQKNQGG